MTLEQINTLTIDDAALTVLVRLLGSEADISIPEGLESPTYADYVVVGATKPALEAAQAELAVYKQELTDAENARLAEVARMDDINARLGAMDDSRAAFYSINPNIPNAALWIKENILTADAVSAEANLAALEAADVSVKAVKDTVEARKVIKEKGRLAANACAAAMALVNGYGQDLSENDEAALMANHGAALQLLQLNKAWSFKSYIEAIDTSADPVITAQMKQDFLDELADYGI